MSIILTILAFNFIIIVHELGHFLIARANGIKVLEFSLFVGPKIWGIKKGDTEYSLRLIPILAYVKMEGEEEESNDKNSFSNKSIWARMSVIAAGPLANLLSALIILIIIFSITGYTTTKITQVENGSPAYESGLLSGDKIVKYDGKKVYLPMDFLQFLYVNNGKTSDITVLRDGEKKDLVITPYVITENRYVLGFEASEAVGENSTIVKNVTEGYPAELSGILPNDKIVALNDQKVSSIQEILTYTAENKDKEMNVTVLRNKENIILKITPIQIRNKSSISIGIAFDEQKGNIIDITRYSVKYVWSNIRNVGYSLSWLVSGQVSVSQMSGPVGIVTTMNDAAQVGQNSVEKILTLLNMTAFISIAIGATNLIPFPALDGNKLLLLLIEAIRKKPIPAEKEAKISMIGLSLLMILAVITTSNDIKRLVDRIINQ